MWTRSSEGQMDGEDAMMTMIDNYEQEEGRQKGRGGGLDGTRRRIIKRKKEGKNKSSVPAVGDSRKKNRKKMGTMEITKTVINN